MLWRSNANSGQFKLQNNLLKSFILYFPQLIAQFYQIIQRFLRYFRVFQVKKVQFHSARACFACCHDETFHCPSQAAMHKDTYKTEISLSTYFYSYHFKIGIFFIFDQFAPRSFLLH